MNIDNLTSAVDKVAVKGFIRRDLKNWFIDDYIKRTLLDMCRKYREELFNRVSIYFTNGKDGSEKGYYIPTFEIAFGEAQKYEVNDRGWLDKPLHLFKEEEIKYLFVDNADRFDNIPGFKAEDGGSGIASLFRSDSFLIKYEDGCFDMRSKRFQKTQGWASEVYVIPCCVLSKDEFSQGIESGRFAYVEEAESRSKQYNDIIRTLQEYRKFIEIRDYDSEHIKEMLDYCAKRAKACREMNPELFSQGKLDEEFNKWIAETPKLNEIQTEIVLNAVLMADTYRCGLAPKERICLEESGEGHWELFDSMEGSGMVTLNGKYATRNPKIDVCDTGIVGIDFGTKSTVVSLKDENNKTRLLRVGTTSYNTQLKEEDVENPTMLEFIDVEKFLEQYKSDETDGRPFTSEEDIRVAYPAKKDLAEAESKELSTFLTDIKQWCGDATGSRLPIIRDKRGYSKPLPAFKDCNSETDIDPLEIYAYYLGLMINNVYNKIFLKYSMSFPTTYEKSIRDRIIQSFQKGIRRSMPNSIVLDDEVMAKFEVKPQCSEPAAYAVCAMKEYQFKPKAEDKIFYSVFDFGGGTTDMIFGIWRAANKRNRKESRVSWVIEQFKDEGDRYLGGENLLELMAYTIFVENTLHCGQEKNFPFIKPADGELYSGLERLTVDSPAARRNMMQLMMKLRPFWEGIDGYEDEEPETDYEEPFDADSNHKKRILKGYKLRSDISLDFLKNGYINIELEDDKGETIPNKLYIDSVENDVFIDLIEVLENRIQRGINTYFNALKSALADSRSKDVQKIYLLLAGNASKSPVLKRLLDKSIQEFEASYGTPLDIEILPPLGTPEFFERMGQTANESLDRPTGKTGVAYGLVDRNVHVYEETSASDEAKFKFYIDLNYDDKLEVKLDRGVEYRKWVPLMIPADDDLELYYTSLPDAQSGDFDISRTKRKNCPVKDRDEDKDFYIRAINPDTIEYGIGEICEDGVFDEKTIKVIGEIQFAL